MSLRIVAGVGIVPGTVPEIDQSIRDEIATVPALARVTYQGSAEDGLVSALATRAAETEQMVALIPTVISYRRAAGAALITIAGDQFLIDLKPSTKSRYPAGITSTGGLVPLPAGTIITGAGATGFARWQVVDAVTVGPTRTAVTLEALDDGPIGMDPSGETLNLAQAVAGILAIEHVAATDGLGQIGQDAETPEELRARITTIQAQKARAQIYLAVGSIPWVVAVAVEAVGPGQIAVIVSPDPIGADQEAELGQAILDNVSPGVIPTGSAGPVPATEPDGRTIAVPYEAATTEAVNVTITGTVPSDADPAATALAIEAAERAIFAALTRGDLVAFGDIYTAAWGNGLTSLTIAAPIADVSPTLPTSLLVPGTITITITVDP